MKLVNNNNNKLKIVSFKRIYHYYVDILFLYNWLRLSNIFIKIIVNFDEKLIPIKIMLILKMLVIFETVCMLLIT